jgi:hypothetical protein
MSHASSGPALAKIFVVAVVLSALVVVGPVAPPYFVSDGADGAIADSAEERAAITAAMDDLSLMFKPLQTGWVTVKQVRSVAFDEDGCYRVQIRTYGWFGIPHADWEMTCSGNRLAR